MDYQLTASVLRSLNHFPLGISPWEMAVFSDPKALLVYAHRRLAMGVDFLNSRYCSSSPLSRADVTGVDGTVPKLRLYRKESLLNDGRSGAVSTVATEP